MAGKLATLGLLKIKVFRNEGFDIISYGNDVTAKFYHVPQIILKMWSCDQRSVTLAFL